MSDRLISLDQYLLTQLRSAQVSHAYIFCGTEAEEQALAFAAALLCGERGKDGAACGRCSSCRHVLASSHPDCRFIDPVNGLHRAESMRHLVAEAGMSASMGEAKVFIMRQADKIAEDAANTLLKLLEEPPSNTTLILLCHRPDSLLPTIISRCQMFVLGREGKDSAELAEDILQSAESLLMDMPGLALYQVLLKSRDYDKDKEGQTMFFLALLQVLLRAVKGQIKLPMTASNALRSANMLESCLDMMDKNANQKLLADVVYLRLWQNCQR